MKSKLIPIIIFVLLITTILPNFIYAEEKDYEINSQNFGEINQSYSKDSFDRLVNDAKATVSTETASKTKKVEGTLSSGGSAATTVATILLVPVMTVSTLITLATRGDDFSKQEDGIDINWFTIEDTVFNRIGLFDANYFLPDANDDEFNGIIKNSVATFYYTMRVLALVIEMIMLIYIGIKMAISTIASEIAKYKDMLKDWLVSMVLIFIMPYIIGMVNMISSGLVEIFASIAPSSFEQSLIQQVINVTDTISGWSYLAVVSMYLIMTYYQIKFFFMYMNRMFSMGFLIVISPLITVFYSATKTNISGKGGKSKVFDKWFKEYTINAFIQPLHAAIYMVFIVSAHEIFRVAPFLAVIFFAALSRAEKIVKNILGMRKMSSINSMSAYKVPFINK